MSEERVIYSDQIPNSLFHVLRQATGHLQRISVERLYIEAMDGDLIGGLFVSQIVFWSGKGARKDGWFYRSAEDWQRQDYMSDYLVRKYAKMCVELGWLETKVMKAPPHNAPTVHYRVNRTAFMAWLVPFLSRESDSANFQYGFSNFQESRDIGNFENGKSKIAESYIHTPITDNQQTQPGAGAGSGDSVGRKLSSDELSAFKEQREANDAAVFELWANNMPGTMTPILADELRDLIDTYGAGEVDGAIKIAVKAGKRYINYVAGILRRRAEGDVTGRSGDESGEQSSWAGMNQSAPDYMEN